MTSVDVFEKVRTGALTPGEGADVITKKRNEARRPSRPTWLPKVVYGIGIVFLTIFLPRLVGRQS